MSETSYIRLLYAENKPLVRFREITGRDELFLKNTKASDAVDLVNRLIVGKENENEFLPAEKIATADRDRILSKLYQDNFGVKIEASIHCISCSKQFELDFSLIDLETHLRSSIKVIKNEQGVYYIDNDCCFRLPTGEDELAVSELNAEKATAELLNRCLLKGDQLKDGDEVQQTMSVIAPVLQTEMVAYCPECGTEQKVQFDIQTYFLTKIIQQQPAVIREIHRLAYTYKWSHHEILDLPRHLRRRYVELIEYEMGSR